MKIIGLLVESIVNLPEGGQTVTVILVQKDGETREETFERTPREAVFGNFPEHMADVPVLGYGDVKDLRDGAIRAYNPEIKRAIKKARTVLGATPQPRFPVERTGHGAAMAAIVAMF